ncbi:MAG: hypothetical protein ACXW3M_10405 [Rhodoplanes sp.]
MRLSRSVTASGSAGFAAAAPHTPVPAQAVARRARLASIDLLRGLVMILMALETSSGRAASTLATWPNRRCS